MSLETGPDSNFDRAARDPLARGIVIVGGTREAREETAARLHQHSRPAGPFVSLDCMGLTAKSFVAGFWLADRGTLYLDEISQAALAVQAIVTKAILGHELGTDLLPMANVRFVAGTNGRDWDESDLAALVAQGRFRADLFHRLHGHTIRI